MYKVIDDFVMMSKIHIINNNINDKVYICSTNTENIKHILYSHILCSIGGDKSERHGNSCYERDG